MRSVQVLLCSAALALGATGPQLPQGVDLIQRIDQTYSWLNVISLAVDGLGNMYLAGTATAIPSIITLRQGALGGVDIVVIKLDPTGQQILYGAAFGGSLEDDPSTIKVDAAGNAYLLVYPSAGFPMLHSQPGSNVNYLQAIVKLSSTGNLVYATGFPWATSIADFDVGPDGSVYFGGSAIKGEVPTASFAYLPSPAPESLTAGYIAKLNPAGQSLDTATYIPGSVSHVLLRAGGDVLYSGDTGFGELNSPLSQRLFFVSPNILPFPNGTEIGIGQDDLGNIYAAGPKALRKYSPDGQQLLYSKDFPTATFGQFAVAPSGLAYLFGAVPPNFPTRRATQPCAPNLPVNANLSRFLMVLGPDGEVRYATYMAGQLYSFPSVPTFSGTGGPYTLAQVVLAPTGPNNFWTGIIKFNPDEIPGDHTSAGCLVHGATLQITAIAPGTIMALFGDRLGPENGTSFGSQDGHVPFQTAGTSVTVDGQAAPVLYAQNAQINFITPWSMRTDGTRVPICATSGGDTSCLYASATGAQPGFFSVQTNVIAAINQDGTINSEQHPALPGSYVSVYLTGAGQIEGPVVDGGIAGSDLHSITADIITSFTFTPDPSACFFHICRDPIPIDTPVLFAGAVPTLPYGVTVVISRVPSHDSSFTPAQFTLRLRPHGQTVDSTASGNLFVAP